MTHALSLYFCGITVKLKALARVQRITSLIPTGFHVTNNTTKRYYHGEPIREQIRGRHLAFHRHDYRGDLETNESHFPGGLPGELAG